MPLFHITFEATSLTDNADLDGAELSEHDAAAWTQSARAEGALPDRVLMVVKGHVAADGAADEDDDIKMFVSATLLMEADDKDEARDIKPPKRLLARLADEMAGEDSITIDGDWEVADVEEPAAAPGLSL